MDYPIHESQETELGRLGGLNGPIVSNELVFTNKKIVQIDHEDETLRRWAGTIMSVVAWIVVFISIGNFLFTFLGWIADVIALGLLPIFIFLIPRYIGKKTKLNISSISREQVANVEFTKPGTDRQGGSFRVNLANGRIFHFGPYREAEFEKASLVLQGFCKCPPTIIFEEAIDTIYMSQVTSRARNL